MTEMVGEQPSQVSPEDALRSRFYGLFADILSDAPEADLLANPIGTLTNRLIARAQ